MSEEEQVSSPVATYMIGQDLSLMSVDEIDETIKTLNDEIQRLKEDRKSKEAHISEAEALFSSKQ